MATALAKIPDGITLEKVIAHPEGLDLGPLKPRMPEVLRTPTGKINAAPAAFVAQAEKILQSPETQPGEDEFLLIGRRQSRSINTWGHNVNILAKGKFRCTLQINPADANKLGIAEGDDVRLNSSTGEIVAQAEITDDLMPGVVSLPHGWGHSKEGIRMHRAQQKPGVNINILMDENRLDAFTGNAVFNAIPVQLSLVG
jgi:Anaerobic dehydrogenases, typically selenocysteine-containing